MKRLYRKILNKPFGRFLIGSIQLSIAYLFLRYAKMIVLQEFFMNLFGELRLDETGHLTPSAVLGGFLWTVMAFTLVVYSFRGLYKIVTFRTGPMAVFNTDHAWAKVKSGDVLKYSRPNGGGDYSNINSTLEYIKCKNASTSVGNAADNILAISGGLSIATHSELSVIEGRLSRMSIGKGADYLMNRK